MNKDKGGIRVLTLSSVATAMIIVWLVYVFVSGEMYRFYASLLFSYYSLTGKMWVSVILLGVTQTFLLIPLRVFRVIRSDNIKEFQKNIGKLNTSGQQRIQVKKEFHEGNRFFLFYLTDFLIQLTTFLTIGRLFLTDFYNTRIATSRLYDFVPYPDYPIEGVNFLIPYPTISKTIDMGWYGVLVVWMSLALIQATVMAFKYFQQKRGAEVKKQPTRYSLAYLVLFLVLAWLIGRHFPVAFDLRIFTGSVAIPNRTLNTITALATFGTLLWFGTQKIFRQSNEAEKMGIDEEIIETTQKKMFSRAVFDSTVVGLGAFFITNNIPSAFELSIFTLEIISLLSPLTLDKLILTASRPMRKTDA